MSSISIRQVAAAAGVSLGSVSRALKNQPGLTEETRRHILEVANRLGYDTGRLRGSRLRRVTLLLHRQHSPLTGNQFYSHVIQGAETICRENGIALSFCSISPTDPVREMLMPLHEPDGFLCVGYLEPELVAELVATGRPTVLVDYRWRELSSVNADNEGGAIAATERLIAAGRRRIAYIHGPLSHHSILQRMRGYRAALFRNGIPADPQLEVALDLPDDYDHATAAAITQLLGLASPPDAVFAYNDSCALAAIRTIQQAGLRVPEDIAVIGFDDIAAAATSSPALATLAVDKEAMGEIGMRLLLEAAAGEAPKHVSAPVALIERASCAPLPILSTGTN